MKPETTSVHGTTDLARRSAPWILLIGLGVAYFYVVWPLIGAPPAESHTLLALEHGARFQLWEPFAMGHMFGPRYAAYYTFIVQNKIFGFWLPAYFVFNALSVVFGLLAAFFLTRALTKSVVIALACALILALFRPVWGQAFEWLTGRQGSLAVMFGCLALLVAVAPPAIGRFWQFVLYSVLLGLSYFAKEFSLAAAGGLCVYLFFKGRLRSDWHIIAPTLFYTATFVLFRLTFKETGIEEDVLKCEDMYYFAEAQRYCLSLEIGGVKDVAQYAYNIAMGLLNGISPGIFEPLISSPMVNHNGRLAPAEITPAHVLLIGFVLACWIVTWFRDRAIFMMCLAMVVGNAVLLAAFFRGRNLGFSDFGVALVIAIGAHTMLREAFVRAGRLLSYSNPNLPARAASATLLALCAFFVVAEMQVERASFDYVAERRKEPELYCRQAHYITDRVNRLNPSYQTDPAIIDAIFSSAGIDLRECPDLEALDP